MDKMVNGKLVPLTPAEMEERNIAQAEWEAGAPQRAYEEAIAQRVARYTSESDPLKNEAEYDAQVSGTAPDYTSWLAKVAEIKADIPLPSV